jgi:adenylate kinase family enzyme
MIGAMGVGKSSVGRALASDLLTKHCSVGNFIRRALAKSEAWTKPLLDQRTFGDNDSRLVGESLLRIAAQRMIEGQAHFVMDGYPRAAHLWAGAQEHFAFTHVAWLIASAEACRHRIAIRSRKTDTQNKIEERNLIDLRELPILAENIRQTRIPMITVDANGGLREVVAAVKSGLNLHARSIF